MRLFLQTSTLFFDDPVLQQNFFYLGGNGVFGTTEQMKVLLAREVFVKAYFAERGWDSGNPTPEQILEIRMQDGWKNPRID